MERFRPEMSNNLLASLAIIVIIISLFNFFMALGIMNSGRAVPTAEVAASGQVNLCTSDNPNITTTDSYMEAGQYNNLSYDVNSTAEDENRVLYTDNTELFNITPLDGKIFFVPENEHVGVHTVTVTATEITCNSLQDFQVFLINVTNMNDPPYLIALEFSNQSETGTEVTNQTHYFPITGNVSIMEDTWYNFSLIADDPDLHVQPIEDYLTYGKIPSGEMFVINWSTGNSTFRPLQQHVGNHSFQFYVYDRGVEIDLSDWVVIEVINVNDAPELLNETVLFAQTARSGEPYYLDVNATDEDGDPLTFNVTFLDCTKINASDPNCTIFTIDGNTGEINFTPRIFDVGNYSVNYSVSDGSLQGSVNGTFTVVEFENHPPNITEWTPVPYEVEIFEGESQLFNITVYDPDSGWNTASIRWFVNEIELIGENGYNYTFISSSISSGIYNVTVVASDGELTDSHEWRLIVFDVAEIPRGPVGAGGVLGKPYRCREHWECTAWSSCSRDGLQIRTCIDLNGCNTTKEKPEERRDCIYSPFPDCYDGITNCHDGLCEILVDCGGPCPPCPTCSDKIRNCHLSGLCEERTDCGGPCAPCPPIVDEPWCGNGICEAGELFVCMADCMGFWIDILIFLIILLLLIFISILLYVYRKESVLLYVYRNVKGEEREE